MKPRPLAILFLLIAGAVVNVAVAWLCALLVDPRAHPITDVSNGFSASHDPGWAVLVAERFGTTRIRRTPIPRAEASRTDDVLPYWSVARLPPARTLLTDTSSWGAAVELFGQPMLYEEARGWPMRSFVCYPEITINNRGPKAGIFRIARVPRGVAVPGTSDSLGMQRLLPFKPIWAGFAINTLFYTAILWLPLLGVIALRRHLRARRGRCPACGYPVGESAVCSECGRAVRSRIGAQSS